jgi:hypothetical protein
MGQPDVAQDRSGHELTCATGGTRFFDNGIDIFSFPDDVPDRVGILAIAFCRGALIKSPLVLDGGRADEAHLIAFPLGEEGDLPPVGPVGSMPMSTSVSLCFRLVFITIVWK